MKKRVLLSGSTSYRQLHWLSTNTNPDFLSASFASAIPRASRSFATVSCSAFHVLYEATRKKAKASPAVPNTVTLFPCSVTEETTLRIVRAAQLISAHQYCH